MSTFRINWPKWDRLINDRFLPLVDNKDRYLLLWGGRGSSKSVFVAKKLIFRCLSEKYFRYILIRNQYNSIKDSQYQTIKDIVYELGLEQFFDFKISPLEINCINGNKFLARGCDDTTKLKSIKDPTGCWWEEDIPSEADFITVTTSIRTGKANYLQEIFSFNPEVEGDYQQHWFWKRFYEGKTEVSFSSSTRIEVKKDEYIDLAYTSHHTTYEDNKWIPAEFVAFLKQLKETNPYYYTIYCLGRWGNKQTDGQFYKLFSYAKNGYHNKLMNGKPEAYRPELPLHISFDFNVNPYMTCTVWQIDGKRAKQIDEICLSTPNNRTSSVCQEFTRRYQGHNAGLFIYGDPAGMHEDTRTEKGYNDFVIIREQLSAFRPSLRLHTAAPPVVMRGNFLNTIFQTGYEGIEVMIGYNCTNTINDYLYLKEASDGTKLKEKAKHPDTGVSYEKYGHCFTGKTMITTAEGEKRIDQINIGDRVLTRNGYKRVLAVHDNGIRPVKTYRIGNTTITCTPDHAFFTYKKGFCAISQIGKSASFCVLKNNSICREKRFVTEVFPFREIRSQQDELIGYIFMGGLDGTAKNIKSAYTGSNGCAKEGRFQKGITSIIKMTIRSIMTLKIWIASWAKSISVTMAKQPVLILSNDGWRYCLRLPTRKPNNGINQRKAALGIASMQRAASWETLKREPAMLAELHSPSPTFEEQNIVAEDVKTGLMQECLEIEERVYDLTVEDEHEYFANGILVHNCSDGNDYLITMVFAAEFAKYQRGDREFKITLGKNVSKHSY